MGTVPEKSRAGYRDYLSVAESSAQKFDDPGFSRGQIPCAALPDRSLFQGSAMKLLLCAAAGCLLATAVLAQTPGMSPATQGTQQPGGTTDPNMQATAPSGLTGATTGRPEANGLTSSDDEAMAQRRARAADQQGAGMDSDRPAANDTDTSSPSGRAAMSGQGAPQ
jgi:hypothetical protein